MYKKKKFLVIFEKLFFPDIIILIGNGQSAADWRLEGLNILNFHIFNKTL